MSVGAASSAGASSTEPPICRYGATLRGALVRPLRFSPGARSLPGPRPPPSFPTSTRRCYLGVPSGGRGRDTAEAADS
jgi:hypothetical protein